MQARNTAEKKEIYAWRLYTYDVWGNHRAGFDVNDIHKTSDLIPIPEEIESQAKPLLTFLKRKGIIPRGYRRQRWEVEFSETDIWFRYHGKPMFELRKEEI